MPVLEPTKGLVLAAKVKYEAMGLKGEAFEKAIAKVAIGGGGIYIKQNAEVNLELFGQEYNPESYAICCSDLSIEDEPIDNLIYGDTLGLKNAKIKSNNFTAVVALPDQMFYNTGIFTYIWLVTNKKAAQRRGTVQLIDGTQHF
jgi:type I restriction-modification system DNA methylase subunit